MLPKRLLQLMVVSALAISAVPAAAAQAAPPEFHFQQVPATITGSGTGDFFTTSVGKMKCANSAFFGVQTGSTTTTTMTLTPEYENCSFLGLAGTVELNGCTYVLHLVAGSSPPTALMDIVCPAGNQITFKAGGCVVHIPPQTGLSHVVFENLIIEGGPGHMQAAVTVTGIEYTLTAGCPGVSSTVTLKSGEYHASWTVKADDSNGKPQGLFVE
jgi:hypothetical protein